MKTVLPAAAALVSTLSFGCSLVAYGLGITPEAGGLALIFASAGLTVLCAWKVEG